MKVLIAPDSFKGSLSAPDAARCIAEGFKHVFPNAETVLLPIADGGEGTLNALVTATGGQTFEQTVTGPLGEPVKARWGMCGDGATAVIELAESAALTQVPAHRRDPKITTTRGVGELLLSAATHPGATHVIVCLGGSATNDGGVGLLSALGVRFLDGNGEELPPGGAALSRLATLDTSYLRLDPRAAELLIGCDVDNPLCGPRGASAVFGPQKGASTGDVNTLDAALTRFAVVAGHNPDMPGAGAAGGTAYGLLWLFPRASLRPGIEIVLDTIAFNSHLTEADIVITGEGRLDGQTLSGKAVLGVAGRAQKAGVPVVALVGSVGADVDPGSLARVGVDAVIPVVPGPVTLDDAMENAAHYLTCTAERTARLLRLGGRLT